MSLGLPRRAQAGVAAGLALTFLVSASSPALADSFRRAQWWLRTLHVTRAWQSTQGSGVTVALLDTGVDPAQADLAGSVITGPDYTNSGRSSGGPLWGIHGSAVASLIAGHGHGPGNADGIMGIAPMAKVLSVRVTLEGGDPLLTKPSVASALPDAIAHGIRYAVRQHAAVIDLPLDPVTASRAPGSGGSRAERAAVAYALAKHVVLVAPAGDDRNGADPVNYPAAYPGVISVGAFSESFVKAPYSSHQPYVTVTAAGDSVTAVHVPKGYAVVKSTSAASALVAGVVALVKAQFPALTPAQVRQVLIMSTVFRPKNGKNDGSGHGTVDAAAALTAAAHLVEAVPNSAVSASPGAAAQAPPSAPPVRSSAPIRKNLGHSLLTDVGLAIALFLVLVGLIFAVTTLRRRRARSARLAEVRAATMVPALNGRTPTAGPTAAGRRAGQPGAGQLGAGMPVLGGNGNLTWTGAGGSASPVPVPVPVPGLRGSTGADDYLAPGFSGRSGTPQIEPVGFVPAPLSSGSGLPRFDGAGQVPGLAPSGATPAGPAPAGLGPSGLVPGGAGAAPGALVAAGAPDSPGALGAAPGSPPWAPIPADTGARFPGGSNAAIPDSAFPGPAAHTAPESASEVVASGGTDTDTAPAGRAARRGAQGSHRASAVRAPQVSGNPPWQPAQRPDSELPWTQSPAPPRGGAGLPQVQPVAPAWEAVAEEVWPGGPRAAGPHPPVPLSAEPGAGAAGHLAGLVPRPTDPQAGVTPPAGRPIHVWKPGATDVPLRAAQPEHGPGFPRITRPGRAPGSSGPARPSGTTSAGPASPGTSPGGTGAAGSVPAGSVPAGSVPAGGVPKTSVPPWEITDSFLAVPAEPPGPPSSPRGRASFPAIPATPAETLGPPRGSGPALAGPEPAGPAPAGPEQAGRPPSGGATKTGVPPWEITDSFLAVPAEPSGPPPASPRSSSSFTTSPADGPSFPRSSSSFPARLSQGPSFPRDSAPFPSTPPSSASGFPRPASPADRTGTEAAAPGESTENIPVVRPPAGERQLPRRVPLSERTGDLPAAAQRSDNAFRLFPPSKNTEALPAVPPTENTEG